MAKNITTKKLLDIINKYVYIVPSVKEAILTDLGLEYDKKLDTRTRIDFAADSAFFNSTSKTKEQD